MSRSVSVLWIVVLLAVQVPFAPAQNLGAPGLPTDSGVKVIRADRVIDGTGRPAIEKGAVLVRSNVIEAVGKASDISVPEGAEVIELGDATLMPGFIDAHTHIIGRVLGDPAGQNARFRDFDSFGAILGVRNAKETLDAGFTTIRNVGAGGFDDIALKKAIDEGWIPGPRMLTAAHSLGITGGHCDENGYRPGAADGDYRTGIADGVDAVRAAVRYQVKYGADLIKTCATGGVLSEGDAVGVPQYTFEELRAMVEEAEKLERKVAAHAHGTEGIKIATRAGVASIEHGSFLDEEGARLMVENGTFLVPTLMAGEAVENLTKAGILTGFRGEKALAAAAGMRNAIKIAIRNNVKIALGTDSGVIPHGTNAREFILMVEWGGMDPMKAINAGTLNAAILLGIDKSFGSLEKGKVADIVAVKGNPLADIRQMEKVRSVMKNGVVIK
ncbi:MAG TPA: amidohydrolase family protein [Aridibacter sp.]|nr:amidohydrolase family protein [Aridibacter sp.]